MVHVFRSGCQPAPRILLRFYTLLVILILVSPIATASPAAAQVANGCVGEHASEWGVICPISPAQGAYIEYVKSTDYGVAIRMTEQGVMHGTTCDGAAELVMISSNLYASLPADQRSQADLLWAEPYITSEVMAHSVLTATRIPELVSHGNPIDIVFADYSTPGSQGLFWHSLNDENAIFNPGTCVGNIQ
jgi:hypothetical protein